MDAGRDAELSHHAGFVHDDVGAPVQLHDAGASHALRQVLVGCADQHLLDARIRRRLHRRRGQRIVRLVFDHGPDRDPERLQHFFEQPELRQEVGVDARAGLVSRPQAVAERLDDVIGGDAHVRGAAIDHAEDRADDAAHGADLTAVLVARRGHGVEVPEQLIRAVDEVNVQSLIPNR